MSDTSTTGNAGGTSGGSIGPEQYLRLHAVSIYVRNQDRSLKFYLEQLGFHLAFDTRLQSGERWVAVAPPDGTALLSLIVPKPTSAEYKLIGRATHIVFITEDVTSTFQQWSRRGVRFQQTPRLKRIKLEGQGQRPEATGMLLGTQSPIWGGVFARFRDVDGNSFSLVSFDEVTHSVELQRRAKAEREEAERRTEQEMEIATRVQARLFPQRMPLLRGLEYSGMCIQARRVGGDYYDFLDLGGQRLGLVIGDISGKGIAAALLMANLQANVRSQCTVALDQPQNLLRSVNNLFRENTPDGSFATLFFAEYDDSVGRLRYANCGHLCALLLRSDRTMEKLGATATVMGAFEDWDCEIEERSIFPGDTFVLYTDGITEAFNKAGDEFGEERLIEVLQQNRDLCCQDLLATILEEVRKFSPHEQRDDITAIVAKCRAGAPH
jgi:serine phosphatase RsbU (regulator of sigma subunit)/catechol 2,3-dioxygenase-like lactoylglutathione lyase family enzyme